MNVKFLLNNRIWRVACQAWIVAVLVSVATGSAAAEPDPKQQARIDVLVVEWSSGNTTDLGTSLIYRRRPLDGAGSGRGIVNSVQSNFPKFNAPSTLGFSLFVDRIRFHTGEMEAVLEALKTNEHVKMLSQQTTFVAEGGQGHIAGSQQVPYESTKTFGSTTAQITQFRDTGVTFNVGLTKIISEEYLILRIAADVTERGRSVTVALDEQASSNSSILGGNTSALSVPEFDTRRISTTVSVRDGDTLVLGGLINKTTTVDERTVPIIGPAFKKLSTVPYIGALGSIRYLFTSRKERDTYRELIFFVTPHIQRGYRVFLPQDFDTPRQPSIPKTDKEKSEATKPAVDKSTGSADDSTAAPSDVEKNTTKSSKKADKQTDSGKSKSTAVENSGKSQEHI